MAVREILAQLTAPGTTSNIKAGDARNHTFEFTVASIDTNVIVRAEGSVDGENFFTLVPSSDSADASASVSESNGQLTVTANGTYYISVANVHLGAVRFNFVSESGGTAATIDAKYLGE